MNVQPDLSGVFDYVDENAQSFLQCLIDYLRHPSISAYGEGIAETAHIQPLAFPMPMLIKPIMHPMRI